MSNKVLDFIENQRLKRVEKKIKKYKPYIINSWKESIRKEYEEEIERLDNEVFRLNKVVAEEHRNMEYWHGKYDAQKEVYDGIKNNMIQKVESTAMKAGEQKEQIKNLKNDLKKEEL